MNALVVGAGFDNSGTTRITSGALVKTGSNNTIVGSPIDFGAAEGNVFVAIDSGSVLELPGTVSGSNGLTKSGNGLLRLGGNNTFTGPLTINAGVLEFSQIASLGADSSPIVIHGGEQSPYLRYVGSAPVTLTRGINVTSGTAALSTSSKLIISGTISGQGGISISPMSSADGEVVLTGTNTYAGPTLVYGDVAIQSDASLGTNSRLVLTDSSGTAGGLRLLGPWNSSRTIEVNGLGARLNTNGFDARWDGPVTASASSNARFAKAGNGTLTLTANSPFDGSLTVERGVMRLTGDGQIAPTSVTLRGGELLFDNTTTAISNRLSGVVETNPLGGRFTLLGHPTQAISEDLGWVQYGSLKPTTLTLTAPGSAMTTVQMSLATNTYGISSSLIIRGDRLGEPLGEAGVTRVRLTAMPPLQGGVLHGILVDHNLTGSGNSFATYDSTVDAGGNVVGLRALRLGEYVAGPVIQTVANGGATRLDANYLVDGTTTANGAVTKLNSITFSGSAKLSLTGAQTLDLSDSVGLLAQRGANATIEGCVIRYGQPSLLEPVSIYGDGNLTFSGSLIQNTPDIGNQPLYKSGGDTLTFKDTILRNDLQINAGTVRVEGNSDLIFSRITLEEGGTLEVGSSRARTGPINGAGNIQLGSGTLMVYGSQSNFAGQISGSGSFEQRDSGNFILETPVTLTGTLGVSRDPARSYMTEGIAGTYFFFTKEGSALTASGISVGPGGGFAVDARSGTQRIGTVPVAINGGNFIFRSELTDGVSKLNVGPVSAQGSAALAAMPFYDGIGAHLEVQKLDRVERGIFRISLDSLSSTSGPKQGQINVADGLASVLVGAGTKATNRPMLRLVRDPCESAK
ncbi:autotransporter-associated beta strand repeat-containing protein [Verrucomicrobiota bacterium sgz303538]